MKGAAYILVLLSLAGCSSEKSVDGDFFQDGIVAGVLDNKEIDEASGLAASVVNPGMLWTHNDSGDKARIFLIDTLGIHQATVWLDRIQNRDWEDIAVGPGPEEGKNYIYIGEIGDNWAKYRFKYIYRIEEPVVEAGKDTTITNVDIIKFQLPDGERDTEALMIDPHSKDLYIFSKREPGIHLYMLPYPQSTSEVIMADQVLTSLPFTQIVAADWSADGHEILIKDYVNIYYWQRNDNEPIEQLLRTQPNLLPYQQEPQGEGIAFSRSGNGYYTLSEKVKKKKPALLFYKRNNSNNE